ncbi:prolyl oligopeptidase family serine peptidase [Caloramator sp. E03]|uniref:prolyl oligopeptidase family serine peptidase n=1 Tax=Caloramator sp. E03 TaxID=2576307 RepID=UPI00143CE45D|nr:prolyl oligopeptidase family serine peptidase [Caloramator sp. E03]
MKGKILKRTRALIAFFLTFTMIFSSNISVLAETSTSQEPSYRSVIEIFDWGAAITKVIIDIGQTITKDSVTTDTFKVHVVRKNTDSAKTILNEGDRKITKAYVSDKDGNAVDSGNFVVLEMEVGPELTLGSPLNFDMKTFLNSWINSEYTITQQKDITTNSKTVSGLVITNCKGEIRKIVDDFTTGSFTNSEDNVTLTFASFSPANDNKKNPLIIWLHGMGEGGTDPTIPISANKADNFASKDIQAYFGGAYILVPQAPTYWMDGFNSFGDGTSKYEKALMALIKDYVSKNNDIDKNRIYIGGDSNGGYMTMLMIRDYPEYFAAAIPTCEALADKLITDADIQKIKNIPIWFTAAKTDTVVNPNEYVVPTYNRLLKAGANNIHFSFFDNVVDTTGLYKKADGTPYEYNGHCSWIYVYNNECKETVNGKTTTIMEWLASQTKAKSTGYTSVVEIKDWGAAITKVIVDLGQTVKQGSVNKDSFSVFVTRKDSRLAKPLLEQGYRKVLNAYVSDSKGNSVSSGRYAVLEMEIGPAVTLGSPLNYYSGSNVWIDCNYIITQEKDIISGSVTVSGLVANKCTNQIRIGVDDFKLGKISYDNVTLTFASFSPANDNKKNPLIIWLHGGGEGGTDATIPLSANKSVNLASKEIQAYFGGAYILVPQAPTYWMDGFTGKADGTSKYEKALMALIEEYVSKNSDIDKNRIYIGGCSNGGYMTMLMIRDYPGYFAAAYPVCEGLKDSLITDEDIKKMMQTPIWFTCAKTDTVLPPAINTLPTYDRLIKAGAKNVQLSYFDNVVDTTGLYKKADGTPYEYNGHWSWIYVYNNECSTVINGKNTTIMEWMAAQRLNKVSTEQSNATKEVSVPKTGDNTPIASIIILMIVSMLGAYLTLRKNSIKN